MYMELQEYLKKDRHERRNHLDLSSPCIEIGGDSRVCRGLMAHHLKTTMNYRKAYVCHACHNSKCSNPLHLYWGTPTDNYLDQVENGTHASIYDRTKKKYHDDWDTYKQFMVERGKKFGKLGGGSNRLSEDISKARLEDFYADGKVWGRTARLAAKWNCSHTQVKRFLDAHLP